MMYAGDGIAGRLDFDYASLTALGPKRLAAGQGSQVSPSGRFGGEVRWPEIHVYWGFSHSCTAALRTVSP